MLEVSTTCRSCMKSNVELVELFVPVNLDNCSLQLADLLMTTVSIQVSREDGLPQSVCNDCVNFLKSVYIFRNHALFAEQELKRLFSHKTEVKNEIDLKCENITDYFETYDEFIPCDIVPKEEGDLKTDGQDHYECNMCKKSYENHSRYLKHMSSHLEPKFFCSACNKIFHKQSSLSRHVDKKCKNAKQLYGTLGNATEVTVKTEKDEDGMFKCAYCPRTFTKHKALTSHLKKHSTKHKERVSYQCDYCNKKFTMKSVLKRHIKLHVTENQYQCSQCSKKYSRQDQLEEHMRRHTGLKPHPCPHCDKAFTQRCSLKDHIRTHTKETPFLCSQCGKGFTNSSNLRQHLLRHSGNKPFSCNLCPKTFYTKGQMKIHISSHTGAHPYECPECGAALTTPSSLKKHRLIHLGVKPHPCDSCSMRFSSKDHLKRHQRIHTGEKPYRCLQCVRAFTQSNDLVKHMRSHVGQNIYQCTICEMKFRLLSELKRHYPIHYIDGNGMTQLPPDQSILLMRDEQTKPEDDMNKHTDNQITITFNSNVLDKDGIAGDITINISPTKN